MPPFGRKQPFDYINFNFENPDRSRLGVGFAVMDNFSDNSSANIFLLAHLYILRPMKPYDSRCLGLVAGTNLGSKIFGDNAVVGFRASLDYLDCLTSLVGWSWQPFFDYAGLVVAVSTRNIDKQAIGTFPMLGIDYNF